MNARFRSILVLFALLLVPAVSSAAPSLDTFLSSLSAPAGTPEPQPMSTGCLQTYQSCLAGCGAAACEQQCQCDYYECRGMDLPTVCL